MSQAPLDKAGARHNDVPSVAFRLELLGEMRIGRDGVRVSPPAHRVQSLLAALLLYPRPQRRERLLGLLFPDVPEHKGRQRLSHRLWELRQALPELLLEANAQEIWLPAEARWLDVEAFRQAAARNDLEGRLEALSLYRGDLLEDIYDEWLAVEREALYLTYVQLSHQVYEDLIQRGRLEEALPLAEQLVQREPFDEHALRAVMKAYQAVGRRGAALAAYDRFVSLATDELGVEPELATQALAQALRSAAARRSAVQSAGLLAGGHPSTAIAEGESSEVLLRCAREALWRGEGLAVEGTLQELRADPNCCEEDVYLLEIEVALLFEEYDRAERLLEGIQRQSAAGQVQVLHLVRAAHLALGRRDADGARAAASEALMLAHEAGDQENELEALLIVAAAQLHQGQVAQATRSAEQALMLARKIASPRGIVRALLSKGNGQVYQGRYGRALTHYYEARSVALEHGLRYHLGRVLRGIRQVQSHTNMLDEALTTVQEELVIWRDLGLARWEAAALEGLSTIQSHLGRSADSLRTVEQAEQVSRQLGDAVRLAINQYHLAHCLVYHDDALASRAVEVAREALDGFQAHGQLPWEAATLEIVGYALWVDGQHGAALDVLRQAYAASERLGELGCLPELLAYQGLAHLGLSQHTEALDLTCQAVLALAQGEVSDEVVPEIYYAHACALSASGREDQAKRYFNQAYECLLAGAAPLTDQGARQAFFHRNPTTRRLMRELQARGIASPPEAGVVSLRLPATRGSRPVQVRWTVDAGPADLALKQAQGAIALRRTRLRRLLEEAEAQGANPTVADLSGVLGVSRRTVQRDLAAVRRSRS